MWLCSSGRHCIPRKMGCREESRPTTRQPPEPAPTPHTGNTQRWESSGQIFLSLLSSISLSDFQHFSPWFSLFLFLILSTFLDDFQYLFSLLCKYKQHHPPATVNNGGAETFPGFGCSNTTEESWSQGMIQLRSCFPTSLQTLKMLLLETDCYFHDHSGRSWAALVEWVEKKESAGKRGVPSLLGTLPARRRVRKLLEAAAPQLCLFASLWKNRKKSGLCGRAKKSGFGSRDSSDRVCLQEMIKKAAISLPALSPQRFTSLFSQPGSSGWSGRQCWKMMIIMTMIYI